MNLVSVIIPTHNSKTWVIEALDSVIAQTYRELEVVVVDDCSQDDTVLVVRKKLQEQLNRPWQVIELTSNVGPSAARNIGLRNSNGTWIQFLDSDDLIAPDKLERQMIYCKSAPADVSAVYSPWRLFHAQAGALHWDGPLAQTDMEGKKPIMCLVGSQRYLHGSGLTRHEVIDRIGGFDESLRFWECEEINVRIAKSGRLEPVHSTEPLYLWRMHPQTRYIGAEGARYSLGSVALSWLDLMCKEADGTSLDCLGLSVADCNEIRHGCTMWARRLYRQDRPAFVKFLSSVRVLDPGFTPTSPKYASLISRYLDYKAAEAVVAIAQSPRYVARKALQYLRLRPTDSMFG